MGGIGIPYFLSISQNLKALPENQNYVIVQNNRFNLADELNLRLHLSLLYENTRSFKQTHNPHSKLDCARTKLTTYTDNNHAA